MDNQRNNGDAARGAGDGATREAAAGGGGRGGERSRRRMRGGAKRRTRKPSRRHGPRPSRAERSAAVGNRRRSKQTKVCVHFLQGRCSWGDRCRFAHGAIAVQGENAGGRKQRNGHGGKGKSPPAKAQVPSNPTPPLSNSSLDVLCDDNVLDAFSFLDVPDLASALRLCVKLKRLVSAADGRVWRGIFHSRFQLLSPRWSATLRLGQLGTQEHQSQRKLQKFKTDQTDPEHWKKMVRARSEEQQLWRCKAGYDHLIHADDRQILYVGQDCEFSTISAAIRVAAAFDKIVVGPGDYSDEHVRINCSLEIVGRPASASNTSDKPPAQQHHLSHASSPVSVASVARIDVDEMPLSPEDFARVTAETTFAALCGKISVASGAKVRFSKLAFGGDDCIISFLKPARQGMSSRKTFCQFEECSIVNGMFMFDQKPPFVQTELMRSVVIDCDSVRTQELNVAAEIRPFGVNETGVDEQMVPALARFEQCFVIG